MAAQPEEITESNHEYLCVSAGEPTLKDIEAELRIIHSETHELVDFLREFRPLLDKYVSNPAARWRRRAVPQDRQG